MGAMYQFTLKHLMRAITYLALGVGALVTCQRAENTSPGYLLWFLSYPPMTAAVFSLFTQRAIKGAIIGVLFGFFLEFLVIDASWARGTVLDFPYHP